MANPPRQTLQLSNSKRDIRVLSTAGGAFTNRKSALNLVKRGLARYLDESTVVMIEDDYRYMSEGRQPAPPVKLETTTARWFSQIRDSGQLGFLRYPQDSGVTGEPHPYFAPRRQLERKAA